MKYNILLIGFMGAGKTAVSAKLSKIMNIEEIDMDEYIVNHEKMPIKDIFDKYGEDYFRDVETKCLCEIQKETGKIVSCGGGVVLKDENVKYMKEHGVIVLLTAKPQTIYERVKNGTDRPILNGNMNVEYIEQLMNRRKERYENVADIAISTDNKSIVEVANEIQSRLDNFSKK